MKLITLLILTAGLHVSATGHSQSISLQQKNAKLEAVFHEIFRQTGYQFFYNSGTIEKAKPVSIDVSNETLNNVLELCFANQPLSYQVIDKTVIIKEKVGSNSFADVTGLIKDQDEFPIEGVTVTVRGTKNATLTNESGKFRLRGLQQDDKLMITSVGYLPVEVTVGKLDYIEITLVVAIRGLDETVVKGYYNTSKRFNTGSTGKVSGEEISRQPVSNPIAALQGRVPGVSITQTSGFAGSAFDILIRGRNSINNGNEPLIIIDGIPFNSITLDNLYLGPVSRQSPLNSINPEDIESIEILKDADATAIYGSRGSNGVLLITTKRGKAGKTKFNLTMYSGIQTISRKVDYMNTKEYLAMRKEAFANDNRIMNLNNAYDLLLWDTTRYTDWQEKLLGGTGKISNVQADISGGNKNAKFLLGANYHQERSIVSDDFKDQRISLHFNFNLTSDNNRLSLDFSGSYSNDRNKSFQTDFLAGTKLSPNAPYPFDSSGNLVWSERGKSFDNPFAGVLQTNKALTGNLVSSLQIKYSIYKNLFLKILTGYSDTRLDQSATNPKVSQNPAFSPQGYATFGSNHYQGWSIEPQLNYTHLLKGLQFDYILGAGLQHETTSGTYVYGEGYTNDGLINSPEGAGYLYNSSNYSDYRYAALFGRININAFKKYIVNLTGRRDGSSRFGPGKQFANFGAAGIAWIFSEEPFLKKNNSFLSFGKLRASYGVSGNDKIGDYRYLETWVGTGYPYQQNNSIRPASLANPDYAWELNRKAEVSLDLGFLHDRITASATWYLNRSGNQLLQYSLPAQTGFTGITKNLPAIVENNGFEFQLNGQLLNTAKFSWTSSVNLTIAKNKLVKYNGLENSPYAYLYVVGQPLNIFKLFPFENVNTETGVYSFSGTDIPKDQTVYKNISPKWYSGFSTNIRFKQFEFDFFLQYVSQEGPNYNFRNINGGNFPGSATNQIKPVLDRWQHPGDEAAYQRYTTGSSGNSDAYAANINYALSDAVVSDASFLRLKNVSLSWSVPGRMLQRIKIENAKLFFQAQNLLTVTNYLGYDPENTGGGFPIPRTVTAGIQVTL